MLKVDLVVGTSRKVIEEIYAKHKGDHSQVGLYVHICVYGAMVCGIVVLL